MSHKSIVIIVAISPAPITLDGDVQRGGSWDDLHGGCRDELHGDELHAHTRHHLYSPPSLPPTHKHPQLPRRSALTHCPPLHSHITSSSLPLPSRTQASTLSFPHSQVHLHCVTPLSGPHSLHIQQPSPHADTLVPRPDTHPNCPL